MTPCPEGLLSYTIQSGDTLWLISQRFRTTVEEIMVVNPGITPNNLMIGQVICVPQGSRNRNMPSQTQPMTGPQTQPATQPRTQPMTGPQTQPMTGPQTQPMTGPQTQPTTQ
ncbi:MAG: LysM peptidoglycan-binding domain-containing protein, partial [Lacrimispora sphenoides]